jgi:drug/metabolite transporter (DMT)-like permease
MATAGLRSFFALFVIAAFIGKPRIRPDRWDLLGAFAYAATVISFVIATRYTTAVNAIVIQYTAPLWVVLLSPLLLCEKPMAADWLAVAGILAGMLFLVTDPFHHGRYTGEAIALISGVTYGLLVIIMRKKRAAEPRYPALLGNLLTALVSIPFIVHDGNYQTVAHKLPLLMAMGFFQLGLPYVLFAWAVSRVSATRAVLTSSIEPILNPVWAFLLVGERPTTAMFIGGAIIIGTVTLRNVWPGNIKPKFRS